MLNVSQTYKGLIKSYAREFSFTISRNSTVLTDAHILDIDIEEAGFSAGELNIGEFCRNSISITAGIAENVTWQKGDVVSVQVQIVGASDIVPLGVFTITEVKRANDYTILITGYDVPAWYSETFDQTSTDVQTNIAYTETTGGMSLTNKNLLTTTTVEIPEGITLSNMDYLRYVAGLDGYNIRSNRQGNLELYKVTPVVTNDPDDPIYIDYIDRENILEDGLSVNDTITSIASFTINGADGYEYKTGTGYGIVNENPFVTENTDKTKMTGYLGLEYYAAEVTFRGDPSLQIGDIVGVPYNDEIVPTIIMSQRFKIDGGISCVIGSRTSQEEKEIVPVAPTEKKIASVQAIANAAQTAAEATNQHFWHRSTDPSSDGAGTGAFVTDEEQDTFLDAIAQDIQPTTQRPLHNLLMNAEGILLRAAKRIRAAFTPSGVAFYDGQGNNSSNVVAAFGADGFQAGTTGKSHLVGDYHSLKMVDRGGSTYFYASDLRGQNGRATITEKFTGDGSKKTFTVDLTVSARVSETDSSNPSNTVTLSDRTYTFTSAPASGATVTIVYETTSRYAKAYTLGTRSSTVGPMSVAEGIDVVASGYASHAEGNETTASGVNSHAEGIVTVASGNTSHAEGYFAEATGHGCHAEGYHTTASNEYSHAEGDGTVASGWGAHAEGYHTTASDQFAHAEGDGTVASGYASHAQNDGTIARGDRQTAIGRYNVADTTSAFIIGNGLDDGARDNAFKVDWNGNVKAAGTIKGTKQTSAVTLSGCTADRNVCSSTGSVATINVGTIKLNAALASGSSVVIGTVPSGYRPPDIVGALCFSGSTTLCGKVYVRITTAGELRMYNYSGSSIAANATAGSFLATYCI